MDKPAKYIAKSRVFNEWNMDSKAAGFLGMKTLRSKNGNFALCSLDCLANDFFIRFKMVQNVLKNAFVYKIMEAFFGEHIFFPGRNFDRTDKFIIKHKVAGFRCAGCEVELKNKNLRLNSEGFVRSQSKLLEILY